MSVPKVNTELGLKIRGSSRNSSNLLLGSAFRESKVSTLVILLLEELNERMLKQHDRFLRQYIIPRKIHLLTPDTTNKIFNIYEPDLTERTVFDGEIVRWKANWAHVDPEDKPTTLHHTLCSTNRELHPNVTAILTIIVTMPVSTATPERSFSTMRRVKTYMRSTMRAERLSGLALLHAYRDRTIDTDKVVQEFCAKKLRRLAFEF